MTMKSIGKVEGVAGTTWEVKLQMDQSILPSDVGDGTGGTCIDYGRVFSQTIAFLTGHSVARYVRSLTPLTLLTCSAVLRSVHGLAHSLRSLPHGTAEIRQCVHAEIAFGGNFRLERANLRPHTAYFRPGRTEYKPGRVDSWS